MPSLESTRVYRASDKEFVKVAMSFVYPTLEEGLQKEVSLHFRYVAKQRLTPKGIEMNTRDMKPKLEQLVGHEVCHKRPPCVMVNNLLGGF